MDIRLELTRHVLSNEIRFPNLTIYENSWRTANEKQLKIKK